MERNFLNIRMHRISHLTWLGSSIRLIYNLCIFVQVFCSFQNSGNSFIVTFQKKLFSVLFKRIDGLIAVALNWTFFQSKRHWIPFWTRRWFNSALLHFRRPQPGTKGQLKKRLSYGQFLPSVQTRHYSRMFTTAQYNGTKTRKTPRVLN